MSEDKVMSIVERMGVFQINKFAWRDEKVKKILKKMVKDGKLEKHNTSASIVNYTKK